MTGEILREKIQAGFNQLPISLEDLVKPVNRKNLMEASGVQTPGESTGKTIYTKDKVFRIITDRPISAGKHTINVTIGCNRRRDKKTTNLPVPAISIADEIYT